MSANDMAAWAAIVISLVSLALMAVMTGRDQK